MSGITSKEFASKPLFAVLIFFAFSAILSIWSLYVLRNAAIIAALSAALTFFVLKNFNFDFPKISSLGLCLAFLVAALAAYPFLLSGFVDASADPAAHISSLAIGDRMPATYAPFSGLEYRYQIGFPLLAKMFIDIFGFVQSNYIVWLLGVIFAFMGAILVYLLSKQMFGSENAGLFGAALFIGSKIVFQNMYYGQYTFMMATVFFLATLLSFRAKSPLAVLFFPIIILAHPGVAFYSIIFFVLWAVFFRETKDVFALLLSGLIALPAFFTSYLPFLGNSQYERTIPLAAEKLVSEALVVPPWIGLAIFALAIASVIYSVKSKKFTELEKFLSLVFAVSAISATLLSATGRVMGGRIIELAMFCALFLSVSLLAKKFSEKHIFKKALLAVILISLVLFAASSELSRLRAGSKITAEETEFAKAFLEFDHDYKKTMFILEDGGKIAQVSGKIPYDAQSKWYVSYDPRIAGNDPFYPELERRHEQNTRAIKEKCIACIAQAEAYYIVADNDFFSQQIGARKVFQQGKYMVFEKV